MMVGLVALKRLCSVPTGGTPAPHKAEKKGDPVLHGGECQELTAMSPIPDDSLLPRIT